MQPTTRSPIVMPATPWGAGGRTASSIHALISPGIHLLESHATEVALSAKAYRSAFGILVQVDAVALLFTESA